jgi:hypothetical protein
MQPQKLAASVPAPTRKTLQQSRLAAAIRIQSIVTRELDAIDSVLAAIDPAKRTDTDRSARVLAHIARAFRAQHIRGRDACR